MATLHIEHPITDFGTWNAAGERYADARRQAGVHVRARAGCPGDAQAVPGTPPCHAPRHVVNGVHDDVR